MAGFDDPFKQASAISDAWSKVGKAAFGGQSAYEKGLNETSKMLAETAKNNAQAGYFNQQTEDMKRRAQFQTPEYGHQIGALSAALNGDQASDMRQFTTTGSWGVTPAIDLPPDQEGPTRPAMQKAAPDWYNDQVRQRYDAGRLAQAFNLSGTGKSDANNMADALRKAIESSRESSAFAQGGLPALNGVSAAQNGNLYSFKEFGTGNQGTGQVAFNQPYLEKNRSEVIENNAQAGNASASAALRRAQIPEVLARTELTRSKIGEHQTITMPDGTVVATGPQKAGKPPTEFQGKSAMFGARMRAASDILDGLDGKYSTVAGVVAGGNGPASIAFNPALDANTQKAIQAKRDFINAVLRQESGAAISPSEFANADRQYFPQPGDGPEVITQKKQNRELAIHGMNNNAGPHSFSPYGAERQPPSQEQRPAKTFKDYGYTSPVQAVNEARDLVKKRPHTKGDVIARLAEMGITNHGIK